MAFAHGVTVLTAATARAAFAALVLLLLLRLRATPVFPLPARKGALLGLGVLLTVQTALIHTAVWLMPVTVAILAFYTFPFLTGVGASLAGQERFTARLGVSLCAAFIGLVLVVGVSLEPIPPLGLAAALGAALIFASVLVMTPKLVPELGAPLRTFYMLSTAALILIVVSAAAGQLRAPADAPGWWGLAGIAMLYGTGITGVFLLLPRMGATQTAVILNMEPVFVAMLAWMTLGESLTPTQVVGGVLVVAAVLYHQLGKMSGKN
jgi:drug/metabolite transporter (DMT)-like permease